jgi:hypothetical protein
MNWLSAHFWQLFGGGGSALLVALLIYFLQRRDSRDSRNAERDTPTGTATVRDSQNSPVALGSGVIQNIVNVGSSPPAPAPAPVETPQPKPIANIQMTGASVVTVTERDWVWKENVSGEHQAAVIQFTNEAKMGVRIGGIPVKALLIYKSDGTEVLRIIGSWLYEYKEYTECRVDEPHKVIVGVRYGQMLVAIERRHAQDTKPHPHDLPEFQTVSVRLTNANNGDVLYEGEFRVTIDPFKIVPLN